MNNFTAWIEKHMLPLASKIGANKTLVAMRDAFATIMPLIIVGSLGTLFANTLLKSTSLRANFFNWGIENGKVVAGSLQENIDLYITPTFLQLWWAGLALLTFLFIISFGYFLAKSRKIDGIIGATFSLSMYFMFIPMYVLSTNDLGEEVTSWMIVPSNLFSGSSLLAGLLITIIFTNIFAKITSTKKFDIKMGDYIPPAVASGFNAIIPALITMSIGGVIYTIFEVMKLNIDGNTIYHFIGFINVVITAPISALGQNLIAVIVLIILMQIFWFFGLHGANIFDPVIQAVYLPALEKNVELINAGQEPINIITKSFLDSYVNLGGSGATLGLLIAIFLISKRQDYLASAKISVGPSIFQINEPAIFGVPIVLNPILIIPFILAPVVLSVIAYFATAIGFAGYTSVVIPWTTPPVLGAFMATNGSIGAAIVALVNLIIAIVIYLPFVAVANKQQDL